MSARISFETVMKTKRIILYQHLPQQLPLPLQRVFHNYNWRAAAAATKYPTPPPPLLRANERTADQPTITNTTTNNQPTTSPIIIIVVAVAVVVIVSIGIVNRKSLLFSVTLFVDCTLTDTVRATRYRFYVRLFCSSVKISWSRRTRTFSLENKNI